MSLQRCVIALSAATLLVFAIGDRAYGAPSPPEVGASAAAAPEAGARPARILNPEALTIEDILGCASRINPTIPIAEAERASILAQAQRARLAWFPRIKWELIGSPLPASQIVRRCVTGDYTAPNGQRYPEVLPCPDQEFQLLDDEQGLGFLAQSRFRLEQPLWTFGKISAGRAAADVGLQAWEAQRAQLERSLEVKAWESFLGVQLTRAIAKIIRYGSRKLRSARSKIEGELEAESGKYTRNDLRRLVIEQAELESRRLEVDSLSRQALGSIRIACQLPPEQSIQLAERKLKPLNMNLASLEEVTEASLATHPLLKAASLRRQAQAHLLDLARAELWPNLAFVGFFNYSIGTQDDENPLANNPYNGPLLGGLLALQWNFSPASFFTQRDGAAAKLFRAEADYQALKLQTRMQLLQSYETARRYQEELKVRQQARRMGKQWFSSTFLNFSAGLTNSDDLTRSLNGYGRASINYSRAIYEANIALIKLANEAGLSIEALQSLSSADEESASAGSPVAN